MNKQEFIEKVRGGLIVPVKHCQANHFIVSTVGLCPLSL